MPNSEKWRWLWRLQIPQRCKIFLWLALNDRLPTNASTAAAPPRVLDFASSCHCCPFCHGMETLLHVLRDCPRAKNTWVHLVAPHHHHAFFSASLWDWMVTYLQQPWSTLNNNNNTNAMDNNCKDGVLFAAMVWLLWKDRKTCVFDGLIGFSPEGLLQRLGTLADDYGRVLEVEHSTHSPGVRYVSWCFYWNQPPSQPQLRSVASENSQVVLPKL